MAQHTYLVESKTRSAIQQQIDAAHADGGGTVYLPPGIYTLDGALHLRSGVRLVGTGTATRLRLDGGALGANLFNTNFIEIKGESGQGAHDVEVRRIHIQGPSDAADIHADVSEKPMQGCGILWHGKNLTRAVVAECVIEQVSGCGVHFRTDGSDTISDVRVEHCRFLQNRMPLQVGNQRLNAGIYKDILFYGWRFENVRVEGNVCTFTPNGINAHGNDSGIAFVSNGQPKIRQDAQGDPIPVPEAQRAHVRNVHIVHNVCSGHRRHGLVTSYGQMANEGVYVAGNTCDGNGWIGIYANNKPGTTEEGRLVITGNRCAHNGTFGDVEDVEKGFRGGIVLAHVNYTIVSDNICVNNGKVSPELKKHNVTAPPESSKTAGIRVRGFKNIITGNLLAENAGDGVMMWPGDVSEISITNNRIFRNGGHGVAAAGMSGNMAREVVVVGNLCTDNTKNGINATQLDGVLLAMNFSERNAAGNTFIHDSTKNIHQPERVPTGGSVGGGGGGGSSSSGGGSGGGSSGGGGSSSGGGSGSGSGGSSSGGGGGSGNGSGGGGGFLALLIGFFHRIF